MTAPTRPLGPFPVKKRPPFLKGAAAARLNTSGMTAAAYPSNWVAVAIGGYQRFISPYKGFCCAYRARNRRRTSCSEFAKRITLRRGLLALPALLRERFKRCAAAARAMTHRRSDKRQQRDHAVGTAGHAALDCAGEACVHGGCDALGEAACCGIDALV